jgi:RNA recognition motif-containing protein
LSPNSTDIDLAKVIESRIGLGHIGRIVITHKIKNDKVNTFAHVEFFDPLVANKFVLDLQNLYIYDKKLKFQISNKFEKIKEKGIQAKGNRKKGIKGTASNFPKLWTTVHVRNLPLALSTETFKFVLESKLGPGLTNSLAGIRLTKDENGDSKGFCYIDLYDESIAHNLVKECNGINIMGKIVKFELMYNRVS